MAPLEEREAQSQTSWKRLSQLRHTLLPGSLIEGFLVLLILGTLFALFWPIVRDGRGPIGDPIPKEPPVERNRVHNSAGFSIVVPPRWNCRQFGSSLLMAPMTPGKAVRRSKALLSVHFLGATSPSIPQGFIKTTVLGCEAYEGMSIVRKWTFDDGARSDYLLFLHHSKNWYHIQYTIAEERTTLPDIIKSYISTIEWSNRTPDP